MNFKQVVEEQKDIEELSKYLKDWAIIEPELSLILGNVRRIRTQAMRKAAMAIVEELLKKQRRYEINPVNDPIEYVDVADIESLKQQLSQK